MSESKSERQMIKEIGPLPKEHLEKRLRHAGYYLTKSLVHGQRFIEEWRHSCFHLRIQSGRHRITLKLHFDPPAHFTLPRNPLAHSRQQGKDIEEELQRIINCIGQERLE